MGNIASFIYDVSQHSFKLNGIDYQKELEEIIALLGDCSGKKILEIGAGTCRVSAFIKQRFPTAVVVATDISAAHLQVGKQKAEIETLVCATELLPQKLHRLFDVVVGIDTLHHHTDRILALVNCVKLLNPGGNLILREVSRLLPGFTLYKLIDKSDFLFSILQRLRYIDPAYFSHEEIKNVFQSLGLEQIKIKSLGRLGLVLVSGRKPKLIKKTRINDT